MICIVILPRSVTPVGTYISVGLRATFFDLNELIFLTDKNNPYKAPLDTSRMFFFSFLQNKYQLCLTPPPPAAWWLVTLPYYSYADIYSGPYTKRYRSLYKSIHHLIGLTLYQYKFPQCGVYERIRVAFTRPLAILYHITYHMDNIRVHVHAEFIHPRPMYGVHYSALYLANTVSTV